MSISSNDVLQWLNVAVSLVEFLDDFLESREASQKVVDKIVGGEINLDIEKLLAVKDEINQNSAIIQELALAVVDEVEKKNSNQPPVID